MSGLFNRSFRCPASLRTKPVRNARLGTAAHGAPGAIPAPDPSLSTAALRAQDVPVSATAFPDLRGNGLSLREQRRRHQAELGIAVEEPDQDEDEPAETLALGSEAAASPAPVDRSCGGCGTALSGRPFQKWCSAACRKRTTRLAAKAQVAVGPEVPAPSPQRLSWQHRPTFSPRLRPSLRCCRSELTSSGRPAGFCLRWPA